MRDIKKQVVPAGADAPSRADLTRLSLSAHTIVPVASSTERAQLLTDLTNAGYAPSAQDPLIVLRLDTGHVEVHTGTTWSTLTRKHYDSGRVEVAVTAPMEKVTLYVHRVNQTVIFTGIYRLAGQAGAGAGTLCTIPAGHTPPSQVQGISAVQGTKDIASMSVSTAGTVTCNFLPTSSATGQHNFNLTWLVS